MKSKRRLWQGSTLCVILDGGLLGDKEILSAASAAIRGGADMIQLRDKRPDTPRLIRTARALADRCRRAGAAFVVNDRIEVAAASGASGVHVGQGDISPEAARRLLGPGKIVGVSAVNVAQARRAMAEGASYVGAGPIFRTPIKPGKAARGMALARSIARLGIPLLAIGGIDRSGARALAKQGVRSVAVIRAVCSARDRAGAAKAIKKALSIK